MTPEWVTESLTAVAGLGAAFIFGCWWGLWLAATRPARMERFATWAHAAQLRLNSIDYDMRGIDPVARPSHGTEERP